MLPTHTPYLCNMYIFIYFHLTVKKKYIYNEYNTQMSS